MGRYSPNYKQIADDLRALADVMDAEGDGFSDIDLEDIEELTDSLAERIEESLSNHGNGLYEDEDY